MTNAKRLAVIAEDQDFQGLLKSWEGQLTARVMARGTSDEDRAAALNEYHAIQTLRGKLAALVADAKQQKE